MKPFASCQPVDVKVLLVKTLVFTHCHSCDVDDIGDMSVELSDRLQRTVLNFIVFVSYLVFDETRLDFFTTLSVMKAKYLHNIIRRLSSAEDKREQ